MPLRVAEVNGWLKAVNKCRECPFMERYPEKGMVCEHSATRMTENEFKPLSAEDVIPVWCPLPEPGEKNKSPLLKLVDYLAKSKEEGSGVLSEEQFEKVIKLYFHTEDIPVMLGKHPENIIWDEPPAFIVEDVKINSSVSAFIWIKPAVPNGPGYEYLRIGDGLVAHDEKESYGYGVLETPTSPKVRISTVGRDPQIGDRLTALSPTRKET